MGRIYRRNGRPVAKVIMYDSPTARMGVVIPKGFVKTIPKTATKVGVKFMDQSTGMASKGRRVKGGDHQLPITLSANTVRKHLDYF